MEVGTWNLEVGTWRFGSEVKSWKLVIEVGCCKLEFGSRNMELRTWKLEVMVKK